MHIKVVTLLFVRHFSIISGCDLDMHATGFGQFGLHSEYVTLQSFAP